MSNPATPRFTTLKEWSFASPKTDSQLRNLELSPADRAQIEGWRRAKWLEVVETREGLTLRSFDSAGTLSLNLGDGSSLVVNIQPKISGHTMATFIQYALGCKVESLRQKTSLPLQTHGFIDLMALLVSAEVDRVFAAGLVHDYQERSDWLSLPRGQIRFNELAAQPVSSRLAIPCRFNQRLADVPLNQMMQSLLRFLGAQRVSSQVRHGLMQRAELLGEYCRPVTFDALAVERARASLDRRSHHYEDILALAELILESQSPGFNGEKRVALSGFFFNMSRLFERFIARLFKEFAPVGYEISSQTTSSEPYTYASNPYQWQRPPLRPDLLVSLNGQPQLVLDTKYKDLDGTRPRASDLYQLTLYSMSFGKGQHIPARLLYPVESRVTAETTLEFNGFSRAEKLGSVAVTAVPLAPLAKAIRDGERNSLKDVVKLLLE